GVRKETDTMGSMLFELDKAKKGSKSVKVALRNIKDQIDSALEHNGKLDAYTASHLAEASIRIERALEAEYIYNANDIGGGGNIILMLGQEEGQGEQ
ncbi:MAG: hypothetical protein AAFS11_07530, partial [Planctomycetota bacterium]